MTIMRLRGTLERCDVPGPLDDLVEPLEVRAPPVDAVAAPALLELPVHEEDLQWHRVHNCRSVGRLQLAVALHAARVGLDVTGEVDDAFAGRPEVD